MSTYRHYKDGKVYIVFRENVINASNDLDPLPMDAPERLGVEYQELAQMPVYWAPRTQFFGLVPDPTADVDSPKNWEHNDMHGTDTWAGPTVPRFAPLV